MNDIKNIKFAVICICGFLVFCALFLIIPSIISSDTSPDTPYIKPQEEHFEYHETKSLNLEGVTQINFDVNLLSNMTFYESKENLDVTLDCSGYSEGDPLTIETEKIGSVININTKRPENTLTINECQLKVGIPKDYNQSIYLSGYSSEIIIGYLENTFEEIKFDMSSSTNLYIKCDQINKLIYQYRTSYVEIAFLSDVFITNMFGTIEIRNISSENSHVQINVEEDIELFYQVLCETEIKNRTGNINLYIPDDSLINLDFESTTGIITGHYNQSPIGVYVYIDTVTGDLNILSN